MRVQSGSWIQCSVQLGSSRSFWCSGSRGVARGGCVSGSAAGAYGSSELPAAESVVISDRFGYTYLSVSTMVHQGVAEGSLSAQQAEQYAAARKPIPHELSSKLLAERLGIEVNDPEWTQPVRRSHKRLVVQRSAEEGWVGGWILDGVIRTGEHADFLRKNYIEPDLVLSVESSEGGDTKPFSEWRPREARIRARQLRTLLELRRVYGDRLVSIDTSQPLQEVLADAGVVYALRRRDVRVALVGPPASGKGRLATYLVQTYGLK